MQARYKAVTPDTTIRDLRQGLKELNKQDPGPERAAELATFARKAHDNRQLNMVMHTTQLCIEEDPDAPALLVDAYTPGEGLTREEALRAWIDMQDLGRWINRDDLVELADEKIEQGARAWLKEADEAEFRHRHRTLVAMFDRAFADDIKDAVR